MRIRPMIAVSFLALCAVSGYQTAGYAAETHQVTVTRTNYTFDDAPKLKAAVLVICADTKIVLSTKARIACTGDKWPAISKSLEFRNSGIGAEFNALIRQLPKQETAAK